MLRSIKQFFHQGKPDRKTPKHFPAFADDNYCNLLALITTLGASVTSSEAHNKGIQPKESTPRPAT